MSTGAVSTSGPTHRWFAWRPVDTDDRGLRWLRMVWRRRIYWEINGHAGRYFQHWVDNA